MHCPLPFGTSKIAKALEEPMIHRNRIAAALLATAFAFALVACGGSGKSAQTMPVTTATGTNPTSTSPVPTPTGPQTSNSSLTVQTAGATSPFYPLLDKSLVNYVPG